jgi:hypothetical protein
MQASQQLSAFQAALLVGFFALFFYVWGTTNLEGLMNYPFWRDMGQMMSNDQFIRLRADHGWKVFPLLVVPLTLLQITAVALVFLAPSWLPRWALFVILAIELLYMAVTIFLEIPIHRSHDTRGYDLALFDRLIAIDVWLRKIPRLIEAPIVTYLLWRTVVR